MVKQASLSFMLSSPAVSVAPSFSRISVATSNGRQTPEPTQEVERVLQHERYYIPSGDVIFLVRLHLSTPFDKLLYSFRTTRRSLLQVENHLFRVHRYFFERESALFRDMLALPAPSDTEREGMSDENPIHLPQVECEEFSRFLWVFYNP